jgi:hypothetical protein
MRPFTMVRTLVRARQLIERNLEDVLREQGDVGEHARRDRPLLPFGELAAAEPRV